MYCFSMFKNCRKSTMKLGNKNDTVEVEVILGRRLIGTFMTIYMPTILLNIIGHSTNYFKPFFFEAVVTVNLTVQFRIKMTLVPSFIVKPWSKSWSQQAPKSNISKIKRKKKDLDLGLTPKSHGQGYWVVLQVQEEGYESSLSFRRSVAKCHKVSMRCPKYFHPMPKYLREFMRGLQARV